MASVPDLTYSPSPLPGSVPGTTQSPNFSLRVPTTGTGANPLEPPFVALATDVLGSVQQILRRMRNLDLLSGTAAFNDSSGWTMLNTDPNRTNLRFVGEVWGYLRVSVQRTGDPITVPSDGNLSPSRIGSLATDDIVPRSLARLSSVNTGRTAAGHVASDGIVYIDALASGADIQTGDIITMTGMFPLLNLHDSEA